jgi:filamentous hemagglutinin
MCFVKHWGEFRLVEGSVAQHREQHVSAPSGNGDERLIVAFALLDLASITASSYSI